MKRIGLVAALSLLVAVSTQAQLNGVTAELLLDQTQYLPGEDVQLKIRIMNRSGQPITLGTDNAWVNLTITRADNSLCYKYSDMPIKGEFSLESGEMGTRKLNPTPYFDFHDQGRYHVSAQVRIPQWREEVSCKAVAFTVANGIPLPGLANLQFGVPLAPGVTNTVPEVRRYSLLKANYLKELVLYFRLTDSAGKTLRVYPIAQMLSFSDPEAQIDRHNRLHVLTQTGAREFRYLEMTPEGELAVRQTYFYTASRPVMRIDQDGNLFVGGGARQVLANDLPPATLPESARK